MYVQNYKYFKYYLKPLILCKLSAEPPHYVPVLLALESPKEFLMLFWAHCAEAEESAFFKLPPVGVSYPGNQLPQAQ